MKIHNQDCQEVTFFRQFILLMMIVVSKCLKMKQKKRVSDTVIVDYHLTNALHNLKSTKAWLGFSSIPE